MSQGVEAVDCLPKTAWPPTYLNGECAFEEAIYILKRDTRHFAKRQLTWFRREKDVTMVNVNEFKSDKEKILEYMVKLIKEKGII